MKKLLTLTGAALVLSSSFAMAENHDVTVELNQQTEPEYIQSVTTEKNQETPTNFRWEDNKKGRDNYKSHHNSGRR